MTNPGDHRSSPRAVSSRGACLSAGPARPTFLEAWWGKRSVEFGSAWLPTLPVASVTAAPTITAMIGGS